MVFHTPVGLLERGGYPPPLPAGGKALRAHKLADARDAHGEQRMGRYRPHALQVEQALRRVTCRECVRELPRLNFSGTADKRAHLLLPDCRSAGMGKGNLLDLGIKVNGVLAYQVHKSDGGAFRKRDPVANRHGAHQFRQVAGLRRGAVDHRGFAVLGDRFVQAGVLRKLLGDEGEHGGLARRIQIADDGFRISLLQLIGIADLHQADGRCKRNGIARVDHIVAGEFSPFEHLGVER